MRYLGWILGSLFLTDGLMSVLGKGTLVKTVKGKVAKRLPEKVENKLTQATDINSTAVTAMGINNLIAGIGMVLIASLTGLRARRMRA